MKLRIKILLLSLLLTLRINSSIVVLDLNRIQKEVNSVIFVNRYAQQNFWQKDWFNDVQEWSRANRLELVLGNYPQFAYDHSFPCLYFSDSINGTEQFISWLKAKYLEKQ